MQPEEEGTLTNIGGKEQKDIKKYKDTSFIY